ncbi:lipase 3-like [Odontomachus brunneus]|uniref:lipase 3-like n=1 Tax=Odontomachus brunneus TaxID=486640 RepID=UPI0013F1FC70|nr:lipase 3-like [Odontomachus brunneus]XP_032669549.1 lipase 3-like [Odontomachus brunneus]
MTRINMKFAIMLIMALSSAELKLLDNALFSRALFDYLFPKDLEIVRVRTLEETKKGQGVKILDFIGLITRYGYPAEEHYVRTEDGYNLKIHRIPCSPLSNNKQNKEIVFMQHGFISSSDSWVLHGPDKDLAFLLADRGYDVWLGNIRGNTYSRSHVKMSPRNADFWQFSYHEIATIDLPNMIDYALNYTGKEKLYYIGHSMGTTMLYVLLSTRPEYNTKIKLGVCLAPIAFWNEVSPFMQQIVNNWLKLTKLLNNNEVHEIFALSAKSIARKEVFCSEKSEVQAICIALMFLFAGSDPQQVNITAIPEILTYYPTSASVLSLDHYVQNIIINDFRERDPGYPHNHRYIMSKPYEVEKITAPLALIYGANDALATKSNVLEIYKRLPNIILFEEIPYKLFTHFDFLWAIDARSILYDHVIDIVDEFEAKQPSRNLF